MRRSFMSSSKRFVPVILVGIGITLVLAVPTAYEGPLLLPINERHAIRLVDALGLLFAVSGWLYLNLLLFRWWRKKRREKSGYSRRL